jgi:hypothetical protein
MIPMLKIRKATISDLDAIHHKELGYVEAYIMYRFLDKP